LLAQIFRKVDAARSMEVKIMQSKTIICLRDKIEGKTAADNHFTNSFQNLSVI
jgi:hypothetical protein